jgi:hypothetical protein
VILALAYYPAHYTMYIRKVSQGVAQVAQNDFHFTSVAHINTNFLSLHRIVYSCSDIFRDVESY